MEKRTDPWLPEAGLGLMLEGHQELFWGEGGVWFLSLKKFIYGCTGSSLLGKGFL